MDYLKLIRKTGAEVEKSSGHPTRGTDRTDKSPSVSFVSESPRAFAEFSDPPEEEEWEFEATGNWIHGTSNLGNFHAWRLTRPKGNDDATDRND